MPSSSAGAARSARTKPTVFYGAPTGYAGMLASPNLPAKKEVALRLASSAGEALPAELGQRFTAHYGVEIIDGIGSTEMLHIFLSNIPGQVRYGTTGWPVPGYEVRAARRRRPPGRRRRDRRSLHQGPERRPHVLGQPREIARHFPGRLDQERRQVPAQCRRQLHLRRPQRRHAQGQRHLRLALRGRGHAGAAPGGAGSRRHRRHRRQRPDQDQGLRRAEEPASRPARPSCRPS